MEVIAKQMPVEGIRNVSQRLTGGREMVITCQVEHRGVRMGLVVYRAGDRLICRSQHGRQNKQRVVQDYQEAVTWLKDILRDVERK